MFIFCLQPGIPNILCGAGALNQSKVRFIVVINFYAPFRRTWYLFCKHRSVCSHFRVCSITLKLLSLASNNFAQAFTILIRCVSRKTFIRSCKVTFILGCERHTDIGGIFYICSVSLKLIVQFWISFILMFSILSRRVICKTLVHTDKVLDGMDLGIVCDWVTQYLYEVISKHDSRFQTYEEDKK